MLIKLAGSSSAMHFFNVNLSKYILKKELTKLNTIIYKILIITSSKSLIVLLVLYFFFFFFCNYRWHKWCGHHRGFFCCNHSSHLDGLVYGLTPPFLSFLSALKAYILQFCISFAIIWIFFCQRYCNFVSCWNWISTLLWRQIVWTFPC